MPCTDVFVDEKRRSLEERDHRHRHHTVGD
jgi:hypothetical protein